MSDVEAYLRSMTASSSTCEPGFYVPAGDQWCPRCGDINWEEATRMCLTCTNPEYIHAVSFTGHVRHLVDELQATQIRGARAICGTVVDCDARDFGHYRICTWCDRMRKGSGSQS